MIDRTRSIRTFSEYQLGEMTASAQRTISDNDVIEFADLSDDHHPAHTDLHFATERFGGRLVHGVLSFAVLVGLTVENNSLAVAYGYDRIRFPHPVLAGDTITATSEVVDLKDHKNPDVGLVVKQYTGVNQHGDIVVVAQHTLAVQRRAGRADTEF